MKWYVQVLSKYAVFEGRARRKEYWSFFLWNLVIAFGVGMVDGAIIASGAETSVLGTIYQLAVLIPSIAVAVRRMHDTNHSGWWAIVPVVSFVFALTGGDDGPNRFGEDPKGSPQPAIETVADTSAAVAHADATFAATSTPRP